MSATTESSAGPISPEILRFDECIDEGGGHQTIHDLKKPAPKNLELCSSEQTVLPGSSVPILLITANVGSIFDDPQNLFSQWMLQMCQQIRTQNPAFVGIHCQEVGGKKFEQSMKNVDEFVNKLCSSLSDLGFKRTVAFIDENFTAYEKFTALGSIYFLHESWKNTVEIYDWQNRSFSRVTDSSQMHLGTIDDVPLVEKHKFPLQYFPESRWARKGYLRTRWKFSCEAVVDMVNIHLFHDASNLISVESVPSIYVNYRKRALSYILDRISGNKQHCTNASNEAAATTSTKLPHDPKPYFIFGDFNFRLDGKSVVKNLTSDLLDITKPENEAKNKQYVDRRSQELVLSIGKKEFALLRGDNTFRGEWRKWTPFDMEPEESDLRDRLTEFPLAFPPTYPFTEDPSGNAGHTYMSTRCPAWCDRVLMSHDLKSKLIQKNNPDSNPDSNTGKDDNSIVNYDVIGKDVCMGDHKPVFLRCHLKLTQTSSNLSGSASDTRCPRVESPSYTDLLSSPPVSNGGCLRFTDIKDPATVKLFKETTV